MSYQPVGGQGGYGGEGYGQHANPYQDAPYGQQNPYDQRDTYGSDPERGHGGYEMSNMNGNDPNRLLNECRNIDRAIDDLEQDLDRLKSLHQNALTETASSEDERRGNTYSAQAGVLGEEIMDKYRALGQRVKKIKADPESGNPRNGPQVGKVDRRLRTMITKYQQVDSEHRRKLTERSAREYRIVRPDASDAEVREAVEDAGNQQIFSQALINSDRRGQAQSISNNVSQRHRAIQKIERDMVELSQLFQDLEAQVIQQEPAVTQIEQRGEEVTEHVAKANTELEGAVDKARAARKKKWWCLGIVVLIIIIIAVVVAVAVTVTRNAN